MPEVTVSILTYSQVALARRCIDAILAGGEDVAFVLTSNGNPEAARYFNEVAARVPNVKVVVNAANEGFWKPNNHALTLCETPFFCMVNDDVMVPRGWLDVLKKPFRQFPNDSAFSGPDDGCSELTANFHGKMGRKEYVEGSCMLADAAVMKKHGLFDPMPGLAYGEDSNASLKFRELGYRLHWVPLRIQHVRAATSRHIPQIPIWQDLNHAYLRQRWATYLRFRSFEFPIVVRRTGAWGDVLLTTPVIRALKKKYTKCPIYVETICPTVFARNPLVAGISRRGEHPDAFYIALDGVYEARPNENFVESYAKAAGVTLDSNVTELYPSDEDFEHAKKVISGDRWIAIHPGPTWPAKMWSAACWHELAGRLRDGGFKILLIGMPTTIHVSCDADLRGITSQHGLAAVIKQCKMFIGVDSFPIHAAQAMGVPVVGLFGVTLPGPILTNSSPWTAACADPKHPCAGLRHKRPGSTDIKCDSNPMDTITVDAVMDAIAQHVNFEMVPR